MGGFRPHLEETAILDHSFGKFSLDLSTEKLSAIMAHTCSFDHITVLMCTPSHSAALAITMSGRGIMIEGLIDR